MKSKVFFVVTLFWVLFIATIASCQQEEITLSTYYPAPFGEYDELCAEKLLVDLPSAAELQDMARGDCHITRSLIVGSGAGTGFSYDELNTAGLPLYDGDVIIKGNVGIGTTGPGQRLEVMAPTGSPAASGSAQNGILRIQGSSGGNGMDVGVLTDSPYATWLQAGYKGDLSINYPLLLNPNGGNVGIGTTGPLGRLDVQGPVARTGTHATSPSFYVTGTLTSGQTGPAAGNIEFRHDNGTQGIGFGYNTIYQTGNNVNQELNLLSRGSSPITLNAYPYSTGNVGIGTTNPQAKLDVSSTTSGFLPPRMTAVQRDNISAPPAGSLIYNTDENNLNLYNGSTWQGMAGWVKIAEVDLSSSGGYTFTNLDGNTHKVYKVIFQGYLAAGGADRRILIRINGSASGYRGYAVFDGDASGANWDDTGFYVGRNGWLQNADFGFEYTISALSGRRHIGFGEATFSHYPTAILGFGRASGYWNNTSNVTSLWVGPSGGAISGKLILLALQ